ncbi:hypothetical protein SAMN05444172_8402 [Burkholderia sp. GAS332]|nr:hypothetical protein SAMN05444172_8402 [Burkholderia sp. GAS332]
MDALRAVGLRLPWQSMDLLPRWRGGPVPYLDFDGVLDLEDVRRRLGAGPNVASPLGLVGFEHAALLDRCVEPHPELRIVASTIPRMQMRVANMRAHVPLSIVINRCLRMRGEKDGANGE